MPKSSQCEPHTLLLKDESLWAQGFMRGAQMHGSWEWFRKDGSKMRSGTFDDGVQVGAWTTYDKTGAVHKITVMKPKKSAS